jgi:DNA/RNA endonuclease YhcR with UshA esterase domain
MKKTLPQGSNDPAPEEIVFDAYKLTDGEAMVKEVTLSGVVTGIPTAYSDQYKNITVNIQVGALAENPIQCYRLSGEGCAALKEGDVITVRGKIKNYKGTIEFDKPVLVGMGIIPDQSATLDAAFALGEGEAMKDLQVLVGTIVSIPTAYSDKYGNITVNIQPLGDERTVQCYRLNGGEGLKEGDVITVYGKIKNYKGTIEFDAKCNYMAAELYSSVKTVFKALALDEGKALDGARQVTGVITAIPTAYSEQYGNITVNIAVGGYEDLTIQCYRLTGGADLKEGDTITVSGNIKDYKGTKEFDKGCTYTK